MGYRRWECVRSLFVFGWLVAMVVLLLVVVVWRCWVCLLFLAAVYFAWLRFLVGLCGWFGFMMFIAYWLLIWSDFANCWCICELLLVLVWFWFWCRFDWFWFVNSVAFDNCVAFISGCVVLILMVYACLNYRLLILVFG